MNLRKNLEQIMQARKLSLKALADHVSVPPSTIHGWLNGTAPKSIVELKKIADFFGISIDELCFGDQNGPKHIDPDISINFGSTCYKIMLKKQDHKGNI